MIMRDVGFTAAPEAVMSLARTHGRLLNATDAEIEAAAQAIGAALQHPLLVRARNASRVYRELPVVITDAGTVLDAVIDLAFVENGNWVVVDFKTDAEDPLRLGKYRRQMGWYLHAIDVATQSRPAGWLLHI
jgi:ATP-dependent exoDNAse (exonuclease V) beta subunit